MKNRGKLSRGPPQEHSHKIWSKSVQRFERRSRKTKKVHADDDNDDDGHSLIASHTHSLSVTKKRLSKEGGFLLCNDPDLIWFLSELNTPHKLTLFIWARIPRRP